MAMIKIVKGDKKLLIPSGAYDKQYAPHGWTIDGELSKTTEEKIVADLTPEEQSEAKDEWDEADEEVEKEKSIDEMTFKELQAKAKELKIDTKNFKQVGEFRKAIKNAIE